MAKVTTKDSAKKTKTTTKKKTTTNEPPKHSAVIKKVELAEEINRNKNTFAYSINLYRSFIDVRDGLKPVSRRILYSLEQMKATQFTKVSAVSGYALGHFHAHGEASVNDAIVKLGQWFYNSYPLVGIHGNWGSVTGDSAAAPRYIEVKQGKMNKYLIDSLRENSVNWSPNYQNSELEPDTLPVSLPFAILNGGFGIGQGYKCQVPPHNFNETIEMTCKILDNPDITLDEVASNFRPDFPTGGIIVNEKAITKIYKDGQGIIKIRGTVIKNENNNEIVITSIPFFNSTGGIVDGIQEAIKAEKITEITRIVDKSKNSGVNILIKVKKGTDLDKIENLLYQNTKLEDSYPVNLVLTEGRTFKRYDILGMFKAWINYRKSTLKRVYNYRIANKRKRVHILEGLLEFLASKDKGLKLITSANDKQDAISKLQKSLGLSSVQSEAVVELPLYRLTKLSKEDLDTEKNKLEAEVKEIMSIVGTEASLNKEIKKQLKDSLKVFKRERRTQLMNIDTNMNPEDLVEDTEHQVFITEKGYIKKLSNEKRRGKIYGNLAKEDHVISAVTAKNKDTLLMFSDNGKVFSTKVFEIRDHKKDNVGDSIASLTMSNEKIVSIVPLREVEDRELIFITATGDIKRTQLSQFKNIKSGGIIATKLGKEDKLLSVLLLEDESSEMLVSTKKALCARFSMDEIPVRLRAAGGVKSIDLAKGDEVISAIIIDKTNTNKYLAVVDSDGAIKKFPMKSIPQTKRAVKGRLISKKKENATVSNVFVIEEDMKLLTIITDKGSYNVDITKIPEKLRTMDGKQLFKIKKNEIINDIIIE